jgi:hypothetical protein
MDGTALIAADCCRRTKQAEGGGLCGFFSASVVGAGSGFAASSGAGSAGAAAGAAPPRSAGRGRGSGTFSVAKAGPTIATVAQMTNRNFTPVLCLSNCGFFLGRPCPADVRRKPETDR